MLDVHNPHEAVVTRRFAAKYHKGVGATVTLDLPTPKELAAQAASGPGNTYTGPRVPIRIVGVIGSPWYEDGPGGTGGLQVSPALVADYPQYVIGDQHDPSNTNYINALVRLRGGESAIPQFRRDIERITGRSNIDVWDLPAQQRAIQRHISFEARCLLAFAIAAFVAALVLIGQAIARFAAASTNELQTLRAVGLSPAQALATAAAGPAVAGVTGAVVATIGSYVASYWFPIGTASFVEPSPGRHSDWLVFGIGIAVIVAVVAAGAVAAGWFALGAARRAEHTRPSVVALGLARAGFPVPAVVGARFALEPGRGKAAVPVRPALVGAVTGVLGIVAAFTFSHGVSDAAAHPERFGQTFQYGVFTGINGQDFAPSTSVLTFLSHSPDVSGYDHAATAVATGPGGNSSISLWEYGESTKPLPVVITSGRMVEAADEVVLAPATLSAMHKHVGDRVVLSGDGGSHEFAVVGAGLVPAGPHNAYSDGGWLTQHGFQSIFKQFKFDIVLVTVRPSARGPHEGDKLGAAMTAQHKELHGLTFDKPDPLPELAELKEVKELPVALGVFLALLAVGAVGHALATAVRRRSHDLAVLRAVGLTQWQCRWVVVTQASVLAVIGLVIGIPTGLAIGRVVWRGVADYTPLQYVPPVALWALLVVGPAALVLANLLGAWPGRRAARLRIAHVLRAE
jgi:ABC-type lipoprotein release transport system permease subunit